MKQLSERKAQRLIDHEWNAINPDNKLSPHERVVESAFAARRLTEIGQFVIVRDDLGKEREAQVSRLPWMLGHGEWVVGVTGISGGYSTLRVRPSNEQSAS